MGVLNSDNSLNLFGPGTKQSTFEELNKKRIENQDAFNSQMLDYDVGVLRDQQKNDPVSFRYADGYLDRQQTYLKNLGLKDDNSRASRKALKYFDEQEQNAWNNGGMNQYYDNQELQLRNNAEQKQQAQLQQFNKPTTPTESIQPPVQKPIAPIKKQKDWNQIAIDNGFKNIDEVKRWQAAYGGLTVDGKIGNNTLDALTRWKKDNPNLTVGEYLKWLDTASSVNPETGMPASKQDNPNLKIASTFTTGNEYSNEAHLKNDFNQQYTKWLESQGYKLPKTIWGGGVDMRTLEKQPGYKANYEHFLKNNKIVTYGDRILSVINNAFANSQGSAAQQAFHSRYNKGGTLNKFQQGGKMNEQLQSLATFIKMFSAQQGQELPDNQAVQIAQQVLANPDSKESQQILGLYTQYIQQQRGTVMARFGTKLAYYKKLKRSCPEGTEPQYFKDGGAFEKRCMKCGDKLEKGGEVDKKGNAVEEFKKGRKKLEKGGEAPDSVSTKKPVEPKKPLKKKQPTKKLDPATTKTLPGGKYPSNWTPDDRTKWERTHGPMDEGAHHVGR